MSESASAMFVSAGYDTLQSITDAKELGRPLFLSGIRKERQGQPNSPRLRLMLDLFDTYGIAATPKSATDNPRIEELTIPREMKRWRLDLSKLPGLLAQGQEMVNHFALEMTKAKQKRPSYQPYATPGLSTEPWRPFYPAHAKAMDTWKVPNGPRKKPSPNDLSCQAWTFYNLRCLLAGNLEGAWAPYGGIAAQMAHIGLILNMAVVENATIAMAYAKQFRGQAAHLARQRTATVDWAHLLAEEDDAIKRNVLRELGHATATMKHVTKQPTVAKTGPFLRQGRQGRQGPKG